MNTVGYVQLLRTNKNFRRLWYGQLVSQLGDWLDSVALFALLLRLTGSGQAVGLLFVAEFLPGALVGPLAGVLIDRLPRKLVLIASDIGRAALVLCLLFVQSPDQVWLVYLVVICKVAMSAFFEPARSAILPSIVSRDELIAANAISGATWSAMLAFGAALGGLIVGFFGTQTAFIIDALSFLLSAAIIATVRPVDSGRQMVESAQAVLTSDKARQNSMAHRPSSIVQFLRELHEGWRYIVTRREVALYTFSKGLWSLGGGVLLLLTLFGKQIFPLGQDGALSIGLLYAARGVGTAIGPIVAQRLLGNKPILLRRAIGPAFFLTTAGYLLLGIAPSLPLAMLAVLLAHTGGSIQWVYSTALLQIQVDNRVLGRVFAVEYALFMLATALSAYLTGLVSDMGVLPQLLSFSLALVFVLPGLFLTISLWPASHEPITAPEAQ